MSYTVTGQPAAVRRTNPGVRAIVTQRTLSAATEAQRQFEAAVQWAVAEATEATR